MRLTEAQCEARAIALEEAADHLDMNWTDDTGEINAGKIVAHQLRAQAKRWYAKALARSL